MLESYLENKNMRKRKGKSNIAEHKNMDMIEMIKQETRKVELIHINRWMVSDKLLNTTARRKMHVRGLNKSKESLYLQNVNVGESFTSMNEREVYRTWFHFIPFIRLYCPIFLSWLNAYIYEYCKHEDART